MDKWRIIIGTTAKIALWGVMAGTISMSMGHERHGAEIGVLLCVFGIAYEVYVLTVALSKLGRF